MNAVFVASGAGIKRGVKLGSIRNLDVAPTIAKLLGLEMKNIEGKVTYGGSWLRRHATLRKFVNPLGSLIQCLS